MNNYGGGQVNDTRGDSKLGDVSSVREKKKHFKPRFKADSDIQRRGVDSKIARPYGHASGQRRHMQNKSSNSYDGFDFATEDGIRKITNPGERGNLSFHRDLRDGVIVNREIQKQSLNPHYKLDLNTKARVRITPLGGLGEIGGNMTVFETDKSAIIVDIGMSFPDEDMHGVDILIPDFTYVNQIKSKIAGVVITHAHEDHIGAVPYFYKHYNFLLYGTPLSLSLVGSKFDEHGLRRCRELFRIIEKRKPVTIGDFEVEWIHITHSIIDSSALAIKTEAGVIIHTGDFKIDHTPVDNLPTDLHRLAYYGEQGVLLMMSDSTNSHRNGVTPSESSVGPTFDSLFKNSTGRVIMSTFSSNIHRVYQAISYGVKYGRKVAVIGRSMEKNIEIARELEYIDVSNSNFIEAHEVNKYDDSEVLIVTTGSQGEAMSALYRMAIDEHRHVSIKPTDMVILSAKAIPGNEGSVSSVINLIMKAGASVAYQDFNEIHVSGHASKEEQKLMLRLVKPKFFLPVHGEYNHIAKHRETAISCGIPEKNILLMEDGDQIEVNPKYILKVRTVKAGKTFIDNQINKTIDMDVVTQRSTIANNGIVIVSLHLSSYKVLESRVNVYGLVNRSDEREFVSNIMDDIKLRLEAVKSGSSRLQRTLEQDLSSSLNRLIFKRCKKHPLIVINIMGKKDKKPRTDESRSKSNTFKLEEGGLNNDYVSVGAGESIVDQTSSCEEKVLE